MAGADPENLDVQLLEFGVIGLPGREVGHSRRGEINPIEFEENQLLPLELAQANLFSCCTEEREVRGWLPNPRGFPPVLLGRRHAGYRQHTGEQHAQYH
jgi:hypothetical protein